MNSDTYKTIESNPKEVLFKDKNSKFFGYVFPVSSEEEVKLCIDQLKKKHHSARHHCYAWRIGVDDVSYRANDDGEPSNSAGQPIYGQIQSFDVTNVLIVVVRYFGGIKLGVGGLINAYRNTALLALEEAEIVEKVITKDIQLHFAYDMMNKVQRVIKEKQLTIKSQVLEQDCQYTISCRKNDYDTILSIFESIYRVNVITEDKKSLKT